MTFNVIRKADGGLVCQCDSLEEAESRIAAYTTSKNAFRIEPDFDMTPRPHPYRKARLEELENGSYDLTDLFEEDASDLVGKFFDDNAELMAGLADEANAVLDRHENAMKSILSFKPSVAVKHDQEKPDYSLLPLADLEGLVEVLQYGAKKYTRNNWKQGGGHDPNRLIAACLRHLALFQDGQALDSESGLSHIHHAACNLVFLMRQIRLAKVNNGNSDSVTKGDLE